MAGRRRRDGASQIALRLRRSGLSTGMDIDRLLEMLGTLTGRLYELWVRGSLGRSRVRLPRLWPSLRGLVEERQSVGSDAHPAGLRGELRGQLVQQGCGLLRHPLRQQEVRKPIRGFGRDGGVTAMRRRFEMLFGAVWRLTFKVEQGKLQL